MAPGERAAEPHMIPPDTSSANCAAESLGERNSRTTRRALLSTTLFVPILGSLAPHVANASVGGLPDGIEKTSRESLEAAKHGYDASLVDFKRRVFQENIAPGSRVLDLGAGVGRGSKYYGSNLSIVSVDLRSLLAKRGGSTEPRENPTRKSRQVSQESGNLLAVFGDGVFDVVVMTLPLTTVTEHEEVLAEVSRVLKPGGKLLVIDDAEDESNPALQLARNLLNPLQERILDEMPSKSDAEAIIESARGLAMNSVERLKVAGLEGAVAYPKVFGIAKKI